MQLIRDGEPRKATSTFTQLLSSKARRTPVRLIYSALWLDPVKKIAGPGEIKTREIEVDSQESPGEIKTREIEVDSQESPGEIKSREAELGSQRKLDSPLLHLFLNNCFSDILTSIVVVFEVLLYVHRNRRFIRDGSPARPPRLSHSS